MRTYRRQQWINIVMKNFSELKAGDSLYVWQYCDIYEFPITDVRRAPKYITGPDGLPLVVDDDEIQLVLKNGARYTIIYPPSSPAMIWGTDGWHEYKIIGTSKEAVKNLLRKTLEDDMKKLKENTKDWLEKI